MAGEYIEFNNNSQPALNDVNINRLQQLIKQDIQGAISGDTLPIGAIMPFGSDTIPDNWLLCNGQAVSRTDYQELFNTIGITYGSGDGFTTFNLPDLQGKIPVGLDENDTDFDTLGNTGGEKTHTLTLNELPNNVISTASTGTNADGYIARGGYTTDGNYNFGGQGQSHNIVQPYIVQNYIIKAKQSSGVVATVIDGLNSTSATDALSANQGKILNDRFNYSTTEKVVGTWIDGKPIYRKVYYSTYPTPISNVNINIGFNNWDEVITLKGLSFSTSDHSVFPIPGIRYYQGTLTGLQLSVVDRNSDWKPNTFYVYTENFAIDKCIIIFEYTKTTD